MVKITTAVRRHKQAGLPYLVYLRHPTTGGVMASWGSLGHITVAEPGALLGFLGPRVYEALYGQEFPEGIQTSENLYARGLIDAVVPVDRLAAIVQRALSLLDNRRAEPAYGAEPLPSPAARGDDPGAPSASAWDSIQTTRHPRRPGVRHLLKYGALDVLQLNGTAQGERDPRMFLALARFHGMNCVLIGQDRHPEAVPAPMGPAFLREARRGMRLAEELRLPLVTVIDTEGAALSPEAENGGLAGEIARSISDLIGLRTPTVFPCCSARAPAVAPWRCCPRTGPVPPATPGSPRCRRKVPAPFATAPPSGQRRWPNSSTSTRPRCSGPASWTAWWRNRRTRSGNRVPSPSESPQPWRPPWRN
jgi:acyl-CoA carboxylase subunit beta